jgi:hypothetical protein
VVTNSVPPYAIVGGVPARVIRYRWNVEAILLHEAALYLPEERMSQDELERYQGNASVLAQRRQKQDAVDFGMRV